MALPVVTLAEASAYFLNTPRNAEWVALTGQQIWLNEAQRLLGALCFDLDRSCCGRAFSDAWTEAISELALALSANPTAIIGGPGSAPSQLVKRQKLGDLELEYQAPTAGTVTASRYGANAPLVLQRFPWLGDVLSCWLNVPTGSSRIIARVRS